VTKRTIVTLSLAVITAFNLQAGDLTQQYTDLLNEHNLIKAAKQNVQAAKSKVEVEQTGWTPDITVNADAGKDNYYRKDSDDSHLYTNTVSVTANQLLWDFGTLNSNIDKAQFGVAKANAELDKQKQYLMLAGLEAQIDLYTANQRVNIAKQSQNNIKEQTKLESARIDAGRGYTTDLLQAKSQLAQSQAKTIEMEGALTQAQNRYKAIFGVDTNLNSEKLTLSIDTLLPKTLNEAITSALEVQPDLVVSKADYTIAKANVKSVSKQELMPKLELVAKYMDEHNPDGLDSDKEQRNIGVQFSWKYNTGLKASKAKAVVRYSANSKNDEYANVKRQVTENTSNAWNQLQTAMKREEYLNNTASILNEFLELARKERELGKRSLLDVLTAETSLLNAKSDAIAANSDVIKAKLNLLLQVSKLDLAILDK